MTVSPPPAAPASPAVGQLLETALKLGALFLLIAWCVQIISPFLLAIVWAGIIAIAIRPAQAALAARLGGRETAAALVTVLVLLALLVVPVVLLGETLAATAIELGKRVRDGTLALPPPPDNVAGWPLIGPPLAEFWGAAADNLQTALTPLLPYLKPVAGWLVSAGTGAGIGLLQTLAAIAIAGVILARCTAVQRVVRALIDRLAGDRGPALAVLMEQTVRGVASGILGVAIIQSLLAGLGMLAAGVPGAGFWTVVALILCVVQLGPTLVLLPAVIYVFSFGETTTAVAFLVWSVFVAVIDNVLKPLLMGRGVKAPIVVLFAGAIGGLLTMGIVGLFVGAVVLVIGHTLLMSWLGLATLPEANPGEAG
jgi:predicted PurR-regulated permease PerM